MLWPDRAEERKPLDPKLIIIRIMITFKLVQPRPMPTVPQRYRRTDRQTDGLTDDLYTTAI